MLSRIFYKKSLETDKALGVLVLVLRILAALIAIVGFAQASYGRLTAVWFIVLLAFILRRSVSRVAAAGLTVFSSVFLFDAFLGMSQRATWTAVVDAVSGLVMLWVSVQALSVTIADHRRRKTRLLRGNIIVQNALAFVYALIFSMIFFVIGSVVDPRPSFASGYLYGVSTITVYAAALGGYLPFTRRGPLVTA